VQVYSLLDATNDALDTVEKLLNLFNWTDVIVTKLALIGLFATCCVISICLAIFPPRLLIFVLLLVMGGGWSAYGHSTGDEAGNIVFPFRRLTMQEIIISHSLALLSLDLQGRASEHSTHHPRMIRVASAFEGGIDVGSEKVHVDAAFKTQIQRLNFDLESNNKHRKNTEGCLVALQNKTDGDLYVTLDVGHHACSVTGGADTSGGGGAGQAPSLYLLHPRREGVIKVGVGDDSRDGGHVSSKNSADSGGSGKAAATRRRASTSAAMHGSDGQMLGGQEGGAALIHRSLTGMDITDKVSDVHCLTCSDVTFCTSILSTRYSI
jgi:hypothetical protein